MPDMTPPAPPDDEQRLAEVASYGMLDVDDDVGLDRLAKIAKAIFDVPIALVGFVDRDRQWFTARQGLDVCETPRDNSFCNHAIVGLDEVFLIPDARKDERFTEHPYVTGPPHIVFYAGAVMRAPNGQPLGTFCVIDHVAHHPSQQQLDALLRLRDQAMQILVARREAVGMARDHEERKQRLKQLADSVQAPLTSMIDQVETSQAVDLNEFTQQAKDHVGRLRKFIAELQQLAHSPKPNVSAVCNVGAVLQELVDGIDGVSCTLGAPERLDVALDGARAVSLLQAVLSNAQRHAKSNVAVGVREEDGHAVILIEDDGNGFDPAIAHRLFEPGFTTVTGRSGLGLFLARQAMQAAGGTMLARSAGPGMGAAFEIRLPLVAATAEVPA